MGNIPPLFPESDELSTLQQFVLICIYTYLLIQAACYIEEGADEMLKKYQGGIVGGLLIPLLGAVPDGMIILFAGLGSGSQEEIQDQLNVGVGTLAGSTIMLLTIPLGGAILVNRRPITTDANGRERVQDMEGSEFQRKN